MAKNNDKKKKKDSPEDPIQKFVRETKSLESTLLEISFRQTKAYLSAAEKHLRDEDGNIDYARLRDEEVQTAFVGALQDKYKKIAADVLPKLGITVDLTNTSQIGLDMILFGALGTTSSQINQYVRGYRDEYTLQQFEALRNRGIGKLSETYQATPSAHLTNRDIPGLISYAKSPDFIDAGKIRLEEAIGIAREYIKTGTVSPNSHEGKEYFKPLHK